MGNRTASIASAVALVLSACQGQGLTRAEWSLVDDWLACEECSGGEMARVTAIGPRAMPALVGTLRDLPLDRKRNLELRLIGVWEETPTAGSADGFVRHHLANAVATAQKRSAVALVSLGALDSVRVALVTARVRGYRSDVVEMLQSLVFAVPSSLSSDGTIAGIVIDPGGNSLEGLTVVLQGCSNAPAASSPPESGNCSPSGPSEATQARTTGTDGRFSFTSLLEGTYRAFVDPSSAPVRGLTSDTLLYILVGPSDSEYGIFRLY
jgi:hypothetical protein